MRANLIKHRGYMIIFLMILTLMVGCKKDWLEKKQNASANIPTTLKDVEEILNLSTFVTDVTPSLSEISSDNFNLSDFDVDDNPGPERNHYLWQRDCYEGIRLPEDWAPSYKAVYNSNLCISILDKIEVTNENQQQWQRLRGRALFFRAFRFFTLSQSFCNSYDPVTAATDLGLVMPLKADINVGTERVTVQQTYDQILKDLNEASRLIPEAETERNAFMPGKAAVEGLLARVYLSMRNYPLALQHAEQSLALYDKLNDFNSLNAALTYPFSDKSKNVEILSYGSGNGWFVTLSFMSNVSKEVYDTFAKDDLRTTVFFKASTSGTSFKGSFTGASGFFTGISTGEMYLISSECKIRGGDVVGGIRRLNQLLKTRYDKKSNGGLGFQDYTITDPVAALDLVLIERRKELFFRAMRWSDLRRLNKETRYAKTLTRVYKGKTYSLPPNDINYTLQNPDYWSGIAENPRHDIVGK